VVAAPAAARARAAVSLQLRADLCAFPT
jgi:hypothetical protein